MMVAKKILSSPPPIEIRNGEEDNKK